MFVHHIAYRFANGDLQEFAGLGLTLDMARQNGVDQARTAALHDRGERFSLERVADCAVDASPERARRNAVLRTQTYLAACL